MGVIHFLTWLHINHIDDAADEERKYLRWCRRRVSPPPPTPRCDAKERPGRQLLRGVQVLQTGDHQEPHRAALHDRAPQGERRRGAPQEPFLQLSQCLFCLCLRPVGVLPGGHLSNDSGEHAGLDCRGVAKRH